MRVFVLLAVLQALTLAGALSWGQTPESQGLDLANRLGCYACHSLKGAGGKLASALDGAGARLSPEKLKIAITNPRQLHPHAKMPSYAYLPAPEQEVLVDYLESLR
ncbi:MAG: c-type cytochrome [Thermodesulfobacteriota bacterium]